MNSPIDSSASGLAGNNAKTEDQTPRFISTHRLTKLDRKESYKAQRKNYTREKKRFEVELLSTLKDESIIVLADWLKVRGTLKGWTRLWCVLKPGLLLLYRREKLKSSNWVGTIIIGSCELIERPSKKDGFCFKLFNPMDQSIWASKGPEGENIGAVVQPLPTSRLIFRAQNNAAGKCWMDALKLALKCSSFSIRSGSSQQHVDEGDETDEEHLTPIINESEVEKHFLSELDGDDLQSVVATSETDEYEEASDDFSFHSGINDVSLLNLVTESTPYVCDEVSEVFGTSGEQTEEISDENKSIVWFLMKQVRPGMDLSRVVLPTFILEPRSFLDKLSDYYYHADIISQAVIEKEPFYRMKNVVRWYLSGFYKKPKGLKKPFNPILGEAFRCYWQHQNGSKTFYIAEQVSHHPPISAFYVANRQDGFVLSSSILAKSKFYGNSTSAILEGTATLSLLPRGEDYEITLPYVHCKGILMGTMTMELGGKISISCAKTGYLTELVFRLKPFLGGGEFTNAVSGKLTLGGKTLATIDGRWDECVRITDKRTCEIEVLWEVTPLTKSRRLERFTVPLSHQYDWESARLWKNVSDAINEEDQKKATEEKFVLEEAQRVLAKHREKYLTTWTPRHFELHNLTERYLYRHADLRPWDMRNDKYQYESDFVILTKTEHKTPKIRSQSIVSIPNVSNSTTHKRRSKQAESVETDSAFVSNIKGTLLDKQRLEDESSDSVNTELLVSLRGSFLSLNQKICGLGDKVDRLLSIEHHKQSTDNRFSSHIVPIFVSVVIVLSAIAIYFSLYKYKDEVFMLMASKDAPKS